MLREKSTSNGGTHPSKDTRGKINSSTSLTEENKPLSSADHAHYNSPQTGEQAWYKLRIFCPHSWFSLTVLCNYLPLLPLHHSYPVRKPSCSQFSTSESPPVIITTVESRGWRGCLVFWSLVSSIPVNITLLLKFMVIFPTNFIYKLITSNLLKHYMTSDLCRSSQMSVHKTFKMQHLVFCTFCSWASHN